MFVAFFEVIGYKFVIPILTVAGKKKFRGKFGIFHDISKFMLIYSTVSGGTPMDVLRDCGWENLGSRW